MAKQPDNFPAASQDLLSTLLPRLPRGVRLGGALVLFVAAFCVAYRYGMAFSPLLSAPFWFPDTVLLVALLLTPRRYWWLLLLATLPLRLLFASPTAPPLWFRLAAFGNDGLKAAASAFLVRRFVPDLSKLGQLRETGYFALFAVGLVPALSALAGAACWNFLGFPFWTAWLQWFLGNALANFVLTTAVLHWLVFLAQRHRAWPLWRWIEGGVLLAGLGGTSLLAFGGIVAGAEDSTILVYAPVPFLFWAAVRFGSIGAASALSVVACFSIGAAAQGRGPFAGESLASDVLEIQIFLFVIGVPMLGLSAALEDRGRAGEALQFSEERYREVVESQTDLICRYLPDTTLTFVNEAYCQFFQRKREDLIGRKFLELIPESAREPMLRSVTALIAKRVVRMEEHEVMMPEGGIGWHQWVDYVIVDAEGRVRECQGIGRDITARKVAEEALRVSEERMLLAAEAADMGFWMCDLRGGEIWITERRREAGGQEHSAPFAEYLERVHPDDRSGLETALRRAFAGGEELGKEYRLAQGNGEAHWLSSRGHGLRNAEGKVTQIAGVTMDITSRKRAEEMMRNFMHATRLALVGEMTASIAHEINQPLGAILSNAEAAEMLLEADAPPLEQVREILGDIRKDDLRASEVIRRLRTLLHKRELTMQPTNLNDVATETLRLVESDAHRRRVTLESALSPEPVMIDGDPVHLQQVLLNLFLNGMDAMKTVPVAERRLVITTRCRAGGQSEAAVTDAGHGIAPEKLARIFDSFFTTKEDGMGLGLAIASSIIETHHGRIWAQNNPGRPGATFYFTIPLRR